MFKCILYKSDCNISANMYNNCLMIDGKPKQLELKNQATEKKKIVRNIFFIHFFLKKYSQLQLLVFVLLSIHSIEIDVFFCPFDMILISYFTIANHIGNFEKINYKIDLIVSVRQIKIIILFSYFNSIFPSIQKFHCHTHSDGVSIDSF